MQNVRLDELFDSSPRITGLSLFDSENGKKVRRFPKTNLSIVYVENPELSTLTLIKLNNFGGYELFSIQHPYVRDFSNISYFATDPRLFKTTFQRIPDDTENSFLLGAFYFYNRKFKDGVLINTEVFNRQDTL